MSGKYCCVLNIAVWDCILRIHYKSSNWVLEEDVKNSEELKNDRVSYTFDRAGWNNAFRRTSITTWYDAGFI